MPDSLDWLSRLAAGFARGGRSSLQIYQTVSARPPSDHAPRSTELHRARVVAGEFLLPRQHGAVQTGLGCEGVCEISPEADRTPGRCWQLYDISRSIAEELLRRPTSERQQEPNSSSPSSTGVPRSGQNLLAFLQEAR